jgi:hypothetical protein
MGLLQDDPDAVTNDDLELIIYETDYYLWRSILQWDDLYTSMETINLTARNMQETRRQQFEDEYEEWLDDVATWRYDFYEDEYKASRAGMGDMFDNVNF